MFVFTRIVLQRSVEWMGKDGGSFLAVGTNHSAVELWDGSKLKLVSLVLCCASMTKLGDFDIKKYTDV